MWNGRMKYCMFLEKSSSLFGSDFELSKTHFLYLLILKIVFEMSNTMFMNNFQINYLLP